jgi:hypothetical protein
MSTVKVVADASAAVVTVKVVADRSGAFSSGGADAVRATAEKPPPEQLEVSRPVPVLVLQVVVRPARLDEAVEDSRGAASAPNETAAKAVAARRRFRMIAPW